MNLKFEISLLILGGILRILGVGWNIWYYYHAEFSSKAIEYACGAFLIAPSVVFLLITFMVTISDCVKCTFARTHYKFGFGLLIAIGGPIGLPLFAYAWLLAYNKSTTTGDFHIIEAISKVTSLIESMFESLPQVGLQVYNNLETNAWDDPLNIIPIVVSLLCTAYTVYKICSSIDKIRQYENASNHKELSGNKIEPNTNKSGNSNTYRIVNKISEEDEFYASPT